MERVTYRDKLTYSSIWHLVLHMVTVISRVNVYIFASESGTTGSVRDYGAAQQMSLPCLCRLLMKLPRPCTPPCRNSSAFFPSLARSPGQAIDAASGVDNCMWQASLDGLLRQHVRPAVKRLCGVRRGDCSLDFIFNH